MNKLDPVAGGKKHERENEHQFGVAGEKRISCISWSPQTQVYVLQLRMSTSAAVVFLCVCACTVKITAVGLKG